MNNRKLLAYFIIFASLILLILNLFDFDFYNLKNNKFSGIISNILLIIAMSLNLKSMKNAEKEEKSS
jgi:hypothetical protein